MIKNKHSIKLLLLVNFFLNTSYSSTSQEENNENNKDEEIDLEDFKKDMSIENKEKLKKKIETIDDEKIQKLIMMNNYIIEIVPIDKLIKIINNNKNNLLFIKQICEYILYFETFQFEQNEKQEKLYSFLNSNFVMFNRIIEIKPIKEIIFFPIFIFIKIMIKHNTQKTREDADKKESDKDKNTKCIMKHLSMFILNNYDKNKEFKFFSILLNDKQKNELINLQNGDNKKKLSEMLKNEKNNEYLIEILYILITSGVFNFNIENKKNDRNFWRSLKIENKDFLMIFFKLQNQQRKFILKKIKKIMKSNKDIKVLMENETERQNLLNEFVNRFSPQNIKKRKIIKLSSIIGGVLLIIIITIFYKNKTNSQKKMIKK